jgi:cystathionine beta-synthase
MSKPWFLDQMEDEAMVDLKHQIKGVIGRELSEPGVVVQKAEEEGVALEAGQGVGLTMGRRESGESGGSGTLVGSYADEKGGVISEVMGKLGLGTKGAAA